jgi:thioredoxin reductase (NADPH)
VIWNKQVLAMTGGPTGLTSIALEDTVTAAKSDLAVTGAFVFVGFKPNSGLIQGHFDHDASGYVITDDRMMTSIPGLFAAGDLRVQLTRQVTTAVGDATTAAIAVEKYLTDLRSQGKLGKASAA